MSQEKKRFNFINIYVSECKDEVPMTCSLMISDLGDCLDVPGNVKDLCKMSCNSCNGMHTIAFTNI